jgi:hypothetical protein
MIKKLLIIVLAILLLLIVGFSFLCKPSKYYTSPAQVINGDTIICETYSLGVFGGGYKEVLCNGKNAFLFDQMANIYVGNNAGRTTVLSFDDFQKTWKCKQCGEIKFIKMTDWNARNSLNFKIVQIDQDKATKSK